MANALTACQLLSCLKHEILQFSQQAFALSRPRCLATIQTLLSPKSHEFKSPLHLMIGEGCKQERYEASKMHLTPCSRHDVRICMHVPFPKNIAVSQILASRSFLLLGGSTVCSDPIAQHGGKLLQSVL